MTDRREPPPPLEAHAWPKYAPATHAGAALLGMVFVLLLALLIPASASAQACGGDGLRACCVAEAPFGACMAGLIEIPGCTGDCQCSNNVFTATTSCVAQTPCGGLGERACCFAESAFGACEAGLVENVQANAGFCTNLPGTQSSGVCLAPTPCGGVNERACCAGESAFGACVAGLIEEPLANTGQCNNLAPGIESQGICRAISPCGGEGQRACCVGEAAFGACLGGLVELPQPNSGQCGNLAWGTQSSGVCAAITPCGGVDERACCLGEAAFGACQTGLVEEPLANTGQCGNLAPGIQSQGRCRAVSPCGGEGQRACCVGEAAFGACLAGLAEVPQANAGQCGNLTWGTQSSSVCVGVTPCGGAGQRACCLGEAGFGACAAGVNEVPGCAGDCLCTTSAIANSTCVIPAPCGGLGQRACCVGEGDACAAGLDEIPGCTGDCFCGPNATPAAVFSSSSCGLMAAPSGGITQIPEPGVNCSNCDPQPQPTEQFCSLPGFSDMHAHMFAHLAHGGAAFVGKPYDPIGGVNEALKQDYGTHMAVVGAFEGGAPPAHVDDGLPPDCPDYLLTTGVCDGQVLWHGDHQPFDDPTGTGTDDQPGAPLGAPLFSGWPTHKSAVHQQMYYRWLERAYRGGMRHMVMMAVHSEAMCEVSVQLAGVDCADSMAQIDLQLQAAYDFQDWLDGQSGGPGQGWFRIVHTPVEARRVMLDGKLAVTLGIEVDNLFNCKATGPCPNMPGHPQLDTVQKAIDFYHDWGVRHVFPVHNFDNAFAGAALWLDPLAVGNRYIEYEWQTGQDCATTPSAGPGYGFRHDNVTIDLLRALACAVSNGPLISCDLGDIAPPYDTPTTCNTRGLTPAGVDLVQRLMAKGMLIDIDHMSNKALDETLDAAVMQGNYPLVASHGQFFDLHPQLYGNPTTPGVAGQAGRHERLRTRDQLDRMRNLGGLVAILTLDGLQTLQHTPAPSTGFPTLQADCRSSTKSWIQGYQYAVEVMQGPVALGTDFNGVAGHTGPRFGSGGCGGEAGVVDLVATRKEERSAQERAGNQLVYPFTNAFGTFDRQVTGQQTFDFNTAGLAHIGLLPDMLADVEQLGMSDANLAPLYRSANRYIEVWEAALGVTCDINDAVPLTISSVTPNSGPAAGGTPVTISGSGFQAGTIARFGDAVCTSAIVTVPDTITCNTPFASPVPVTVSVTNPDGQFATLVNGYTYIAPAPTVSSVTPNAGPAAGGTPVTISGSGFQAGTIARFGDAVCTSAIVTVPDTITCNTPFASPVPVDVTVTNPDGQFAVLVNGYEYTREPTTATINASANPVRVGESVSFATQVVGTSVPSDGQVAVTASSGESCIDDTPQVNGASASFSCQISFGSLGPRTASAVFSNSATHLDSSTALNLSVARFADLSVSISDGQDTVQPGEALSYLIAVRNAGPDEAPGSRLMLASMPELGNTAWTCSAVGSALCPTVSGTGELGEQFDLPAGSGLDFVQTGVADTQLVGALIVNVAVSGSAAQPNFVFDSDSANNSASDVNDIERIFANGFE